MTRTTWTELDKPYMPSGKLWRGIAIPNVLTPSGGGSISQSGNPSFGFFDNFHTFNATSLDGPYASLMTSGGTLGLIADTATEKGLLGMTLVGDTAEDEVVVKWGGTSTAPFKLADNDLVFECRLSVSAITTAKWNIAVGLGEADMIVSDGIFTDADILADNNFLGFVKLLAETGDWDGAYKADGETYQDGGTKTKLNALATFTASSTTYIKLGFRYRAHPKKVEFYVDGTLPGGNITPARLTATEIDADTFPDDVFLAPIIGIKDKAGDAALTVNLDWWGCAQLLG